MIKLNPNFQITNEAFFMPISITFVLRKKDSIFI
jgi:hypothetical protein